MLFPGGSEVSMANQTGAGYYRAEMLYLPAALLRQFRKHYPQAAPSDGGRLAGAAHDADADAAVGRRDGCAAGAAGAAAA
ncbi:hypothetical protein O0544_15750 [Edwardsiella anguillarum]|nr:hypothetical protein [Edwardsiella anguillarum]